ncbi:MAG: tetratricopeptide repeat protein [Bacteroidales bacterium]|nr:tetratricopeptide repeat protein [Bacteroidales bacterium]
MEQKIEDKNTEMGSVITRSEEFIQKNQKTLITAIIVVLVVILAIFGLRRWYFQPREDRAASEMFAAEQWFGQGDFQKALDGDDNFRGFNNIAGSYKGTKAGNLARYYAGICNLRLGNFEEAANWLKKYNGKDTFTRPLAKIALGDAEMELGNTKAAVDNYVKAAEMEDNFVTTPTALFKAGMGYMMLNNNQKALECFKKVKNNYPESTEWGEIDKYIQLASTTK